MSRLDPALWVRCGSCGQRATTTISLRGVTVPVCLRHYNVWKTPDFDADAAMLAEARAEGLREAVAAVRQVYDMQCPPRRSTFADDDYGKGAWTAHQWWSRVLGGVIDRLADRADPGAERTQR